MDITTFKFILKTVRYHGGHSSIKIYNMEQFREYFKKGNLSDDDVKNIIKIIENIDESFLTACTYDGTTILEVVVKYPYPNIIKAMLKRYENNYSNIKKILNIYDYWGYNFLHYTIMDGCADNVKHIVNFLHADDLLSKHTITGSNILHLAMVRGCKDIVEILLKVLPDDQLVQKNNGGFTPLCNVFKESRKKTIEYVEFSDEKIECIELLIDKLKTEQLCIQNSKGRSLIFYAFHACEGIDIVKKIIEKVEPKQLLILDKTGTTSLHYIVMIEECDLICMALSKIDREYWFIKDASGKTPLDYRKRNKKIRALFDVPIKNANCI